MLKVESNETKEVFAAKIVDKKVRALDIDTSASVSLFGWSCSVLTIPHSMFGVHVWHYSQALKRVRVGRFGNALQTVKKELSIWKRFKHRHIVVLREVIDTDGSQRGSGHRVHRVGLRTDVADACLLVSRQRRAVYDQRVGRRRTCA